jgi:protein-L-isoaspartate(D-aspartate) O-methyltransferase
MDVERARFNMIEQQIRTWNVVDPDVLELLQVVRREDFLPPAYRSMAFTDMEVPLVIDGEPTGEVMFAPMVEARLLQELAVRKHETVLEIGAGSGHMAALLAHRARHVDTVEINPALAQFAAGNLDRAGVTNAAVREGDGSRADVRHPLYDVIVLSGSVSYVPDFILERVNVGGRITAIVGRLPVMQAQIIDRVGEAAWRTTTLFETVAKPLAGFPVRDRFKF